MVVELGPTTLMSSRATSENRQQCTKSLLLCIFQLYMMYFQNQRFIFTVLPFGFASLLFFSWFHCRAVADEGDIIIIIMLLAIQ